MLTAARLFFGLFFVGSAGLKVVAASTELEMMRVAGFDNPLPFYIVAATAQAILGSALLAGFAVREACLGLIAYVAVINWFMHPFWVFEGEAASIQFQLFSKNVGIMAGLFAVAGGWNKWATLPRRKQNA